MQNANKNNEKDLIYPELSYFICGIGFEVHNQLGRYKSEKQYADAYEQCLKNQGIKYIREKFLPASFEGENNRNKPDFLIEEVVVVDLKAKFIVSKEDYYQMRRYLESANKKLGIILNFRQFYLRPKRVLSPLIPH